MPRASRPTLHSKALSEARLASLGGFGLGGLLSRGWRAVADKLSKLRSPDFKILNINAVAGIVRFIARGDDMSTALQGISGTTGMEASFAVGWMLQSATPRYQDIVGKRPNLFVKRLRSRWRWFRFFAVST
jgi:hypothetical protein